MEKFDPLEEGIAKLVPENGLKEKLALAKKESRPLIIKLGFDPTAPDLHLGHAVVLKKLKEFQDAGHKIVVILGDFTAYIGDPTGKNKARPPLAEEQIQENARTYLDQLSKVLDVSKIEVKFNSEWFDKMSMRDTIKLVSATTLAQIIERRDFKQRYESGISISTHELIYPILQGYDSVAVNSDIEIGGTDQLFNILVGRYMQEVRKQAAQIALCMPLLRGIDGSEKMSKSQNNYIGLTEEPENMYGKIMSIPDALLEEYIDLTTNFSQEEKGAIKKELQSGKNPMEVKKLVAANVVAQYHNQAAAQKAEEYFYQQVQKRDLSSKEYKEVSLQSLGLQGSNLSLVDLCAAIEKSKSKNQVRELIKSGSITVDGTKITDVQYKFANITAELQIKIGKRGFYKVSPL